MINIDEKIESEIEYSETEEEINFIESYEIEETESIADSIKTVIEEYFHQYVVETVNGSFQVFQSFTYGEMVIATLLTCILFLMTLRFFFEVIR